MHETIACKALNRVPKVLKGFFENSENALNKVPVCMTVETKGLGTHTRTS
jgi:hypothetical protein